MPIELAEMFPTDDVACKWFESVRWPKSPYCPRCGSMDVQSDTPHPSQTHRSPRCPKQPMFSLKTSNVKQVLDVIYSGWF